MLAGVKKHSLESTLVKTFELFLNESFDDQVFRFYLHIFAYVVLSPFGEHVRNEESNPEESLADIHILTAYQANRTAFRAMGIRCLNDMNAKGSSALPVLCLCL